MTPDRNTAFSLLKEYVKSESLLKHALSVEAVMRYRAKQIGEDENKWGLIGLIHDIDFEMYPQEHCKKAVEILEGWPAEYIRAVVSHGYGICSDVKPEHEMEKFLYAAEELTGLVSAAALVRPSKSILDMETKSVKKKWKDKTFAAGVNRVVIEQGAEMLGIDLDELIGIVISGMTPVANEIGLAGSVG